MPQVVPSAHQFTFESSSSSRFGKPRKHFSPGDKYAYTHMLTGTNKRRPTPIYWPDWQENQIRHRGPVDNGDGPNTDDALHSTELCSFVTKNPGLCRNRTLCCVRHTYREGKYQNLTISSAFRLPAARLALPHKLQGFKARSSAKLTNRLTGLLCDKVCGGDEVLPTLLSSILMAIQSIISST